MNAAQLSQLIEKIVSERVAKELAKRLPTLVEAVLTKRYLKDLVSEHTQNAAPRLKEVVDVEDEQIPAPMPNTDHGIYHKGPTVKEQKRRPPTKAAIDYLAKGNSDFAALFADVTPMGHPDSPVTAPDQELVPEAVLNEAFDMERIQRLANVTVPKKRQTQQVDPELALKQQRQRLDERVIGARPAALPQMEVPRHRVSEVFEEDPFESRMREIESKRNRLGF